MRTLVVSLGIALLAVAPKVAAQDSPDLAGLYDGSQPEMAAYLGLAPEGSFRFALSIGALDLEAEGTWRQDGGCAVLQSDPFEKPRFELVGNEPLPPGQLELQLTVEGGGDLQYFDYVLTFPDAASDGGQMSEEGAMLEFGSGEGPISAMIVFPLFDLRSDQVALSEGEGRRLIFNFVPNELGKVEFAEARACTANGELVLPFWDDTLGMRRVEGE